MQICSTPHGGIGLENVTKYTKCHLLFFQIVLRPFKGIFVRDNTAARLAHARAATHRSATIYGDKNKLKW